MQNLFTPLYKRSSLCELLIDWSLLVWNNLSSLGNWNIKELATLISWARCQLWHLQRCLVSSTPHLPSCHLAVSKTNIFTVESCWPAFGRCTKTSRKPVGLSDWHQLAPLPGCLLGPFDKPRLIRWHGTSAARVSTAQQQFGLVNNPQGEGECVNSVRRERVVEVRILKPAEASVWLMYWQHRHSVEPPG